MHTYQPDQRYSCPKWDVIDITFEISEALPDPFAVTFGAVFRGPDNAELCIPGFYNGDHTFLLRFSPLEQGGWSFETFSSLGALAGQRGSVQGLPQANPERHGPIVLDRANPQHFFYRDGTPYFALAFEADWLFALDAENETDIPQTKTLVDQVRAYGLNQVVMNVYAYDTPWKKDPSVKPEHEFGAPGVFPFGGTNDDPDFITLNVTFFKRLDRLVRTLDQCGIVAHLMIYVWNKQVNWPDMVSQADNRYFDHVVARYQAFSNVIWDVSKEALGYGRCDMDYINERIDRLRRLDAYRRLLTVHDYQYCAQFPEKVDFISIQSWRSDLYHVMTDVRKRHPQQPILNIEHGGYERGPYLVFVGDYLDPEICLERNYQCIFAGTYSTYYWQCTSWDVVIPDPMGLPEADRPRFDYYRHIVDLFSRYDYTALQAVENRSSSGHCLSNGRDLFLYLVPKENDAIHIILPPEADKYMQVTWFNPLSGEFHEQSSLELRPWHGFESPWKNQIAILILQRQNEKPASRDYLANRVSPRPDNNPADGFAR